MLGLRTAIYKVSDLGKATSWYSKAFDVQPYFNEPFYVGFNVGGFELGLQPETPETKVKGENVLCYWGVSDIHATFSKLIEIGGVAHEQPQNVGGELMVAAVKDPWENILGIIYNPYFEIKKIS